MIRRYREEQKQPSNDDDASHNIDYAYLSPSANSHQRSEQQSPKKVKREPMLAQVSSKIIPVRMPLDLEEDPDHRFGGDFTHAIFYADDAKLFAWCRWATQQAVQQFQYYESGPGGGSLSSEFKVVCKLIPVTEKAISLGLRDILHYQLLAMLPVVNSLRQVAAQYTHPDRFEALMAMIISETEAFCLGAMIPSPSAEDPEDKRLKYPTSSSVVWELTPRYRFILFGPECA